MQKSISTSRPSLGRNAQVTDNLQKSLRLNRAGTARLRLGPRYPPHRKLPTPRTSVTNPLMSSETSSAASPKKLSLDDVRHVAMLSRLALDEDHLKRLT